MATSSTPTQPAACTVPTAANVPVPSGCVYFGAWANPAAGAADPASVNGYTTTLESQIGQKLRVHMHYYGWGTEGNTVANSTPSFPDQAEIDDENAGRIPLITWGCSDDDGVIAAASPTVNVSAYNLIVATARAVKTFNKPIFIRWFWEMNLTNKPACSGNGTMATQYANFIGAWQNIYNIFKSQGATNVSWVWNPAGPVVNPDAAPYYPGNAYVDWIGWDGYDKVNAHDFGTVFNPFYQEFENATYGNKPIMIAETGECPTYQAAYLAMATTEIASRANSGGYAFPMVRAFLYFDSPGQYTPCTWNFDTEGIAGFEAMGNDTYFAAP